MDLFYFQQLSLEISTPPTRHTPKKGLHFSTTLPFFGEQTQIEHNGLYDLRKLYLYTRAPNWHIVMDFGLLVSDLEHRLTEREASIPDT